MDFCSGTELPAWDNPDVHFRACRAQGIPPVAGLFAPFSTQILRVSPSPRKISQAVTDGYDPGRLLSALRSQLRLRSDNGLARALEVPGELIQKVRSREIPVTPELLIRMEEVSGWSGRQLRDLMGDRRSKFRFEQVRNSAVGELISEIYATADAKKAL